MSVITSKRIVHLRKKNKILLDKLEAHSSKIKSDLRVLSELPRNKWNREEVRHKMKDQCKSLAERSDFPQSRDISSRKILSSPCSAHSNKLKVLSNEEVTEENRKTENTEDTNKISSLESSLIDEPTDFFNKMISRSQQEVVSLLDYSPKSTFLRKMKSKYLGYSSSRNSRSQRHQKSSINSPVTRRTCEYEPQSYVDEVSMSEEGCQSKGDSSFERLKNFIDSNWLDCHVKNQEQYVDDQIKTRASRKYHVNERLFAVPVDMECGDYVYCASCQEKISLLDVDPDQLVVSIPSSLLFRYDSFENRKSAEKLRTERRSISSAKKLFKKPKPTNSMALRFQKGIQ